MPPISQIVEVAITQFVDGVILAIPKLITGGVFLVLAYISVKVILTLVRTALDHAYPAEQALIADLGVTVTAVFLWFGIALVFLKIIGMGDIAASLGTATGFVALGVSYALSEMIEDTVAGVYLLRDPDFNIGDRIITDRTSGAIAAIELRKTRIDTDAGNRVVLANRDIEEHWTHERSPGE